MPLPSQVFCDTSFFYACLDPGDTKHVQAQAIVAEAAVIGTSFSVTWDIISETVTLFRYRRNFQAAVAFLTEVKPRLRIVAVTDRVLGEAAQIFKQYGRTHRFSFCDAVSFVVVTTLLDNMPCLAFDEDFRRLGLTVIS
jgi:predicted nucleic acid-binding protein